jgi:hypothetical protein
MLAEHLLSPASRAQELKAFPRFELTDQGLAPTRRANG